MLYIHSFVMFLFKLGKLIHFLENYVGLAFSSIFYVFWFLTPKIPSVFLPISAVSSLLGGIHFSTKKSTRT
jgi:hypothetical protein